MSAGDNLRRTVLSLDAPVSEEGTRLEELVAGDDNPEVTTTERSVAKTLLDACNSLPTAERRAVSMRYLDDMKLREVGVKLGVSESRVCQLCKSGIKRLRTRVDLQAA